MASSTVARDALTENAAGPAHTVRPEPALRARTLELLWHCHERNEEAERYGLVQAAQTPEGVLSIDYTATEGGRLVTTGGDMCIRLWKLDEVATANWLADSMCDMSACCRFVATMRTSWMPLTARWSPHGQMIASAHCEGKVCLWWRDQNSAVNTRAQSDGAGATASPSSAAQGNTSEEEWKDYRHLSGHISDVHDICFSSDSRYLLSGAGDGSIVIHDLDGSPMPIIQLTDLHSKFCRGVSWDPWGRYIHTFGCGPALQCFTVVPRRQAPAPGAATEAVNEEQQSERGAEASSTHRAHHHRGHRVRQLQLANQRRCHGDFIGESCALSFRRLDWSPDGTLLAVPFGKTPRTSHSAAGGGGASPSTGARAGSTDVRRSTEDLFAAIDAHQKKEAASKGGSAAQDTTADRSGTRQVDASAAPARTSRKSENEEGEDEHDAIKTEASPPRAQDMLHCVQIYARGTTEAPVARLTIRGYSEIRGAQWAPCFLTPEAPSPHVAPDRTQPGTARHEPQTSGAVGVDVLPQASSVSSVTPARLSAAHATSTTIDPASSVSACSPAECTPAASTPSTAHATTAQTYTSANGQASVAIVSPNAETWSLSDYRMALAVWTSDAVIVYTTDQLVRHSDFTDLHMRSITDVAWNASATYLFTAALDGYVSVIAMGNSLSVAYRLPSFSTRPMTQRLMAVLQQVDSDGAAVEQGRVDRREASRLAAEACARASREAGSGGDGSPGAAVVVVRKKKKVEAKPVVPTEEVQIDQLEALMDGL